MKFLPVAAAIFRSTAWVASYCRLNESCDIFQAVWIGVQMKRDRFMISRREMLSESLCLAGALLIKPLAFTTRTQLSVRLMGLLGLNERIRAEVSEDELRVAYFSLPDETRIKKLSYLKQLGRTSRLDLISAAVKYDFESNATLWLGGWLISELELIVMFQAI